MALSTTYHYAPWSKVGCTAIKLHAIPDILEDLRRGRMIVLVDDEQRENEGDLVCAGEFATAEVINFMITQGRGM